MKLIPLFLSLFLGLGSCAHHPSSAEQASARIPSSLGPHEYGAQKLLAKGASQSFVDLILKNYREDQRDKVLELNILGFIKPSPATGEETIPGWELKRVRKFVRKNKKALKAAEKEFDVPKEVIASLLWVETRHGKDVGRFHVASALMSLVVADYPTLMDKLIDTARKKANTDFDKLMEAKVQDRAKNKGEWAANELVALQEIHKQGWKNAAKLHGSFSGAFGMAQFIPSSYLSWAKSSAAMKARAKSPNLFRADDSIFSVANYLKSNGWESNKREAQEGALFHYNRDRAYVARILKMSDCLKRNTRAIAREKKQKRETASAPSC